MGKHLEKIAEILDTTVEDLEALKDEGKTWSGILEAAGLTQEEFLAIAKAEHIAKVQGRVQSGDLTQEEADNIMEYSPLHVNWMMRNIRDLQDDVRLAKQFCKACGVYGAESYIRGFSGHTLDILVIHFKGFLNFLKAAAEWGEKVVIDYGNYHKGKALEILNVAKTQSPLVVVDPVFHERNAAANLNTEKFEQYKECTKACLNNHSEKFFIEKKVDLERLE